MKTLYLPLKAEYFDAIVNGTKTEEFRLRNDYWKKRLENREYDDIVLTKGYPKSDDHSRRLHIPFNGFGFWTIIHPHFGDKHVDVYAIDVSKRF